MSILKLSQILDWIGTYYGLIGIVIDNNIAKLPTIPLEPPYVPSPNIISPVADLNISPVQD